MRKDEKLSLYLANRTALVDVAAPIVGCRSRAEDVVQDAYLKLNEATLGDGVRHPLSYLFRLVRNLAIDRSRRQALENRHGAREEIPEAAPCDLPSPEQTAVARDTLRQLQSALAELPPRTRRVFEMHRMEGRPVDEIAAELGISVRTVYGLMADAMTHCRDRLFGRNGGRP